jgi:competence protein ComEA
MFTSDERRAFYFLMAIAVAGGLVRLLRPGDGSPGAGVVAPHLAAGDLARQAAAAQRAEEFARPLAAGETVDLDIADAAEIERLPRIGPDLARRIVRDREARGPFGSLEGLARVPGLGAATLALMAPSARFSGTPRPEPSVPSASSPRARGLSRDGAAGRAATAATPARSGTRDPCATVRRPLPLNAAEAAELACLPGVGPALAARIVADRQARGPFAEVQALERVPGIGPARLARLAGLVSAP